MDQVCCILLPQIISVRTDGCDSSCRQARERFPVAVHFFHQYISDEIDQFHFKVDGTAIVDKQVDGFLETCVHFLNNAPKQAPPHKFFLNPI